MQSWTRAILRYSGSGPIRALIRSKEIQVILYHYSKVNFSLKKLGFNFTLNIFLKGFINYYDFKNSDSVFSKICLEKYYSTKNLSNIIRSNNSQVYSKITTICTKFLTLICHTTRKQSNFFFVEAFSTRNLLLPQKWTLSKCKPQVYITYNFL